MSGLFTRCWQVGRRLFWPHLLFGMVAASVGLPGLLMDMQASVVPQPATHKPQSGGKADFANSLSPARLEAVSGGAIWRRQTGSPTAVRHGSYSLAVQIFSSHSRHQAEAASLALPYAAMALQVGTHYYPLISIARLAEPFRVFRIARWISQVQGIRAGPNVLR